MAEWWEWTGEPGPLESNAGTEIDWSQFTSGGPGSWANQTTTDGGNNWLSNLLGGLGSMASQFGGAAATTIGSLVNANRGSNAAQQAGQQQNQALNRGIDLQTAQWLQQQQNLAPYLQAGQQGLSQLQQLGGREQPGTPAASTQVQRQWYDAQMPQTTPGWQPQTYAGPQAPNATDFTWNPQQGPQAQDFRWQPGQLPQASQFNYQGPQAVQAQDFTWQPGQGPRAQDYRYTPGQTPDAAQYASQAPQLYQGAMPGTQVPTLSGQELLAQDPGAAFRQSEARRALESSAAARGGLLSGGTLQALQSRSQDLASQEYGNAWERTMRRNTEQYGRDWGQYQQRWNQGVTGAELGLRTNAQNFGQAMDASRLREQTNQVASQQGWSQAQTEAVFREQMAQQASQQGFNQALGAQGQEFQQGLANRQYDWQRAQAEATLREQINQQASQQGWTQAQAEATFREQQAQLASQQGWNQALAGQQNQFTQGLQAQQWNQQQQEQYATQQYQRQMEQNRLMYGRDFAENQTNYERNQTLFRQQLAQFLLPWEQASTLANLGGQATTQFGQQGQNATNAISNLLGQAGTAQASSTLGSALAQNQGTTTTANSVASVLSGLNA